MTKTYIWSVNGRGAFPLDMLRFDACYPATSADVDAIQRSLDPLERREAGSKGFSVTLRSQIAGAEEARWNSFGWRVSDKREERR
jgi:hypothetical protein